MIGIRYAQKIISCFQEDIGPNIQDLGYFFIRIFINCRCPSFRENVKKWSFGITRFIKRSWKQFVIVSWFCFVVLVSPKIKLIGFGDLVAGSELPKSQKWGVLVSPISKSIFYYTKSKQDNCPKLLNLLFKEHNFHKNDPTKTMECRNMRWPILVFADQRLVRSQVFTKEAFPILEIPVLIIFKNVAQFKQV